MLLALLKAGVVVSLAFTSGKCLLRGSDTPYTSNTYLGVASCLSIWVIPIILRPENRSKSMIAQFEESVNRGERILQPTSRALTASLFAVALMTYPQSDGQAAEKWKYYAIAGFTALQVAWYEIFFVFPINRQVSKLRVEVDRSKDDSLSDAHYNRLASSLKSWQLWQWGRVILPAAASVIAMGALL